MNAKSAFSLPGKPMLASELIHLLEYGSPALDEYLGEKIYFNSDPKYLQIARRRLAATVNLHMQKVGNKPVYLLRAPGRLNAFLEYLDMCAGDHMSTTIDGDTPVCVSLREDDAVRTYNINSTFGDSEFDIASEVDLLKSAPWEGDACAGLEDNWDNRTRIYPYFGHTRGDWMNYVRSPFLRIAWEVPAVALKGVDMTIGESSIPLRGGTSSSSAMVVLSFLALYLANSEQLPKWDITYICKLLGEAEWYVGTHGGANDQTTILRNVPNGILYNRHSQDELDSTILPSLKGVRMVVANSLWEASKATGANHVFNLRKGWMDLGDDLMKLIISAVTDHLNNGEDTEPGWIGRLIHERFSYAVERELNLLESSPELWEIIQRNYRRFGSLDESLLGVPDAAIEELISLLPQGICVDHAAAILKKNKSEMDRDYTLPYSTEGGGYLPMDAALFFHKENTIGRNLERIFIEADAKLNPGGMAVDSPEYKEYQVRVGKLIERLQDTLRDDFQVSNSQIDLLLNIASRGPGYLGGKLTGAGCGGCVTVMVRGGQEEAFCRYLDQHYYGKQRNFNIYREYLETLEPEDAVALNNNLSAALQNIPAQRWVVTFSAGAGVLDVAGLGL